MVIFGPTAPTGNLAAKAAPDGMLTKAPIATITRRREDIRVLYAVRSDVWMRRASCETESVRRAHGTRVSSADAPADGGVPTARKAIARCQSRRRAAAWRRAVRLLRRPSVGQCAATFSSSTTSLRTSREYARDRYEEAQDAHRGAEETYRSGPDAGVVLLSADSREARMVTHGRPFEEERRHLGDYVTGRLDELLSEVDRTAAKPPQPTPSGGWIGPYLASNSSSVPGVRPGRRWIAAIDVSGLTTTEPSSRCSTTTYSPERSPLRVTRAARSALMPNSFARDRGPPGMEAFWKRSGPRSPPHRSSEGRQTPANGGETGIRPASTDPRPDLSRRRSPVRIRLGVPKKSLVGRRLSESSCRR